MSLQTLDENSLRNPVYELTGEVWWEEKMLELDACTNILQCRRILEDLLPATNLSPDTRKRIVTLMLVLFENQRHESAKCFELFCFAVKIYHEQLCEDMLNDNLVVEYARNIAYQYTLFQKLTLRVFKLLYLHPFVLQDLADSNFFRRIADCMTHLPDSNENRKKIQIWFTLCETYIGATGSVQWVRDAFPDGNLFIFVIRRRMYKYIIFEEICKRYSYELSYVWKTINQWVPTRDSTFVTAPLEMIRCLCLSQGNDDDILEDQTHSLIFMLKMANLNLGYNRVPNCYTPIHALVICHRCVSAYTHSELILDFLNSGAIEYDRSIRCDIDIGDSLYLPSCTALELTRHLIHLSNLQGKPPSEFLQNIEGWLLQDVL